MRRHLVRRVLDRNVGHGEAQVCRAAITLEKIGVGCGFLEGGKGADVADSSCRKLWLTMMFYEALCTVQ